MPETPIMHRWAGEEVGGWVSRLADSLVASLLDDDGERPVVFVGIANGGIALNGILARLVRSRVPFPIGEGIVNVSFHRDDIGRRPIPRDAVATRLDHPVEGSRLVLVDDVIQSGRTVRAAINEVFDQGRPAVIQLAVLVDRGGRALPVQPDFLGHRIDVPPDATVRVELLPGDAPGHVVEVRPR